MSDARRGLPLLSEPPPILSPPDSEIACRKCSKEFNLIFVRSRKCNHCGYLYCHSCSDFQALMPRLGSDTGYDPMHVCGYCIEFLTSTSSARLRSCLRVSERLLRTLLTCVFVRSVTAAGRNSLKALPLAKLKRYMLSYDIKIDRAVEKDDIIDGIVAARGPSGCLPRANENFYRKYSVPNKASPGRTRGLFSRSGQGSSSAPPPPRPPPRPASAPRYEFPRPDLEPDHPPQPHTFRPPDGPPPSRPPRPQQQQQHNSPPRPPPHRPNPHYSPPSHPPPPSVPPRPSHADGGSRGYRSHHGYGSYGGHVPPTPAYMTRPQPPAQEPPPQSNYHSHSSPPRAPAYTSAPPPPPPPPRPRAASAAPPPNLDQLVEMTTDSIGSLSISALKSILFTNHVTTGQILEKGDLVKKVLALVADEKAERVRQRLMEEREEMERIQREMERTHGTSHFERHMEEQTGWQEHEEGDREANDPGSGFVHGSDENKENEGNNHETNRSHDSSTPASPPHSKPTGSTSERPGICVICQDDDANIAIIDCGHMAMCKACSELVMASSKECPLCRTRIVTEARLLRIFRT